MAMSPLSYLMPTLPRRSPQDKLTNISVVSISIHHFTVYTNERRLMNREAVDKVRIHTNTIRQGRPHIANPSYLPYLARPLNSHEKNIRWFFNDRMTWSV